MPRYYEEIDWSNPYVQAVVITFSFLMAGLAFLYYHYVYMPYLMKVWTWYGFPIMFIPIWFIYGIHEITFYIVAKSKGIDYEYTLDPLYALIVMIVLFYGSFSLFLYMVTGLDFRIVFPVIFVPALAVRILSYRNIHDVDDPYFYSLLVTFLVTMLFVMWFEFGMGGFSVATARLTYGQGFWVHGVYSIALYGLFVCMVEALPIKIGNFAFDGYEAMRDGLIQKAVVMIILAVSFYLLVYGGYLEFILMPLGGGGGA